MATTTNAPQPADDEAAQPTRGKSTISERIAAFTMLDEMDTRGKTQAEKTLRLWLIGFSNQEIAKMLQTSAATVSQNLYAMKRNGTKRIRRTSGPGGGA